MAEEITKYVTKVKDDSNNTYDIKDTEAVRLIMVGDEVKLPNSRGIVKLEDSNMLTYDGCPKIPKEDGGYEYKKNIKYLNNGILSDDNGITDFLLTKKENIETLQ